MKKTTTIYCALLLLPFLGMAQVQFVNQAGLQGIIHSYGDAFTGGGVSFCDFTGDGLDDLTLATDDGAEIAFYENTGNGFDQLNALVAVDKQTKQVLWVDYDNDGDKDLFVANFDGPNQLFRNQGNLQLQDVTLSSGLPVDSFTTFGACFGDFDRDGWLDLYVSKRFGLGTTENEHFLYKNNSDGTFTNVTVNSNSADAGKIPFCSSFFDMNNDKWPDLYTAHDKLTVNTLLRNNGDGSFSDVGEAAGANLAMNAMCVAVGDYNNDGWLDLYISNTPEGNALLMNNGDETFTEVAAGAGVGFYSIGWGSVFLDADNDGWEDLYVSGSVAGTDQLSSAFYLNNGDGTFSLPNSGFAGDTLQSFNNAVGDFNDDGFPDIIVNNITPSNAQLWKNNGNDNQWLKMDLQGVLSNRDAIGTRIELYAEGIKQTRFTHCGIGFLGQNSSTQIFGLGTATQADSVLVVWPTGHIDRLYDLSAGQRLLVTEGSTTGGMIDVDPDIEIVLANQEPGTILHALQVFPNPSSDLLNVTLEEVNTAGQWFLFDGQGRVLRQQPTGSAQQSWQIDISNLPAGTYQLYWLSKDRRQYAQERFLKL